MNKIDAIRVLGGAALRDARHAAGEDREAFARRHEVAPSFVHDLEAGYALLPDKSVTREELINRRHAEGRRVLGLVTAERQLREALESFAKIELPSDDCPDGTWVATTLHCNNQVTAIQVRRARAAIEACYKAQPGQSHTPVSEVSNNG